MQIMLPFVNSSYQIANHVHNNIDAYSHVGAYHKSQIYAPLLSRRLHTTGPVQHSDFFRRWLQKDGML